MIYEKFREDRQQVLCILELPVVKKHKSFTLTNKLQKVKIQVFVIKLQKFIKLC